MLSVWRLIVLGGCYRWDKGTFLNCTHMLAVLHSSSRPGSPVRELLLLQLITGDLHVNSGSTPFCSSLTFNPFPCHSSCLSSFFFSMVQEKEKEREREKGGQRLLVSKLGSALSWPKLRVIVKV